MPRRNDAPWRNACIERYGDWCRACKRTGAQADHMVPRAHGGPSVVANGLMLCRACHDRKTAHELLVRRDWLTREQIDWLAEEGYARWDSETGEVTGVRRRIFAPDRGKR